MFVIKIFLLLQSTVFGELGVRMEIAQSHVEEVLRFEGGTVTAQLLNMVEMIVLDHHQTLQTVTLTTAQVRYSS